jgi:cytidylate kinase
MLNKTTSERFAETMERTGREWHRLHQAEEAGPAVHRLPPAYTIALSRESGANGSRLAQALGERLGWPVYDHELLERVAAEMGLHADLLEGLDERRKGWLEERLEELTGSSRVSQSAYTRRLLELLLALAAHGNCIIVGRGAAQMLPLATTLRVRLVAPVQERVATVRERLGVSRAEAWQRVQETDAARTRFVQDCFLKDPADPRGYDLVLNAARFAVADCAELVLDALHRLQAHTSAQHPHPLSV